ncbi:hypothetical protein BH10CHL1_BH10CHL1_05880 [soil metagenome]
MEIGWQFCEKSLTFVTMNIINHDTAHLCEINRRKLIYRTGYKHRIQARYMSAAHKQLMNI